jgi:pimeloyl-ACP methyl ester carboxylesterase
MANSLVSIAVVNVAGQFSARSWLVPLMCTSPLKSEATSPRAWRCARRLAFTVVALYLGSAVLLGLFEEALLRWHAREGVVRGSGEDVWLRTEDGVRLYARYYRRDPSLPVLLYLHGGAGNFASRSDRLGLFADLGASLFALEYRGYGPSEGTYSERGLERDASAAYAWLRQRTEARKIVPFGESLGGGPATWLASTRPVGGLILLSTSTSVPDLAGHFLPWLPTQLLMRTRFDNLRRVRKVTAPKLFIHFAYGRGRAFRHGPCALDDRRRAEAPALVRRRGPQRDVLQDAERGYPCDP